MDQSPKVKKIKAKRNKWDLLKSFCTAKETIDLKKKSIDWKKIFANDVTDKGLISKIYTQLIQFKIKGKKTNNLIKN